jgi:hypothetical protein
MIEPVLELFVPDELAILRDRYVSGSHRPAQLIVLLQAYNSDEGQSNIEKICTIFASTGAVRLFLVDGAWTELLPGQAQNHRGETSEGVLRAQRALPEKMKVVGVDEPQLLAKSDAAVGKVRVQSKEVRQLFDLVVPVLNRAQERLYDPRLRRNRLEQLRLYGGHGSLRSALAELCAAALELQIPRALYPSVWTYRRLQRIENTLDFALVEAQRLEFVNRIAGGLGGWISVSGPTATANVEQGMPYIAFWLERTGQGYEGFFRNLNTRGMAAVVMDCQNWFRAWMAERELSSSNAHVLMEDLIQLAMRVDIPFYDLTAFRTYASYTRDAAAIRASGGLLFDEAQQLAREVALRGGEQARHLFEVEQDLDLFFRALRLSIPSDEADSRLMTAARLSNVVSELYGCLGEPVPALIEEAVTGIEPSLAGAREYMDSSNDRGRAMVRRALDTMKREARRTAILIVGGYHQRAITWKLEEDRNVSWSLLLPQLDASKLHHDYLVR